MRSLQGIRDRCKAAHDPSWYDRQYALRIFMAGYADYLDTGMGSLLRTPSFSPAQGPADIADYPLLNPDEGHKGVQNHGLVNARINIQGVVLTKPKPHLSIADATEREINEVWLVDRWVRGKWHSHLYRAGLDVETSAIGWLVCGGNKSRMVDWKYIPVVDMLFDRGYEDPGDWRHLCYRVRVPLDDAVEQFGHIFNQWIATNGPARAQDLVDRFRIRDDWKTLPAEALNDEEIYELIKSMCVRRIDPLNQTWSDRMTAKGSTTGKGNVNDLVLVTWHYWDGDNHLCFLKTIDGQGSLPLAWLPMAGEDSEYNYQITTEAGENPYPREPEGVIPAAWWIDSWAPGIARPTSKSETVKPIADMLNHIEHLFERCLKDAVSVWVGQSDAMTPEFRKQWAKAKSMKDVGSLVESTMGGDWKNFLNRIPVAELPAIYLQLRAVYKEELNSATGVGDMQRSNPLSGPEKTRKEVTDLVNMGGVQARFLRNQYALCLEMMVGVTRAVGSVVDTAKCTLFLEDGSIQIGGEGGFKIKQFLQGFVPCSIDPTDFIWRAKEEIQAEALAFLTHVSKGIELGVVHPYRLFKEFARQWSKGAEKVMYTEKEMLDNQKAKEAAAKAAQSGQIKELIVAAFKDLPDELKQRWAQSVGLAEPGEHIDFGPSDVAVFEQTNEIAKQAHEQQSEEKMQDAEHEHELTIEAMKARAVAAAAERAAKAKPTNGQKTKAKARA